MSRNAGLTIESRRTVPWIIWTLWKNRNNLIFDGKVFHQFDMLAKIKDDSDHWFLAQQVQKEDEQNTSKANAGLHKVWKPPDNPWLKCNIASSWDKHNKVGGAAWVLRNSLGVVLLHSRCSFSEIETKQDAELSCWLWAIESMHSLKIRNLLLSAEEKYLMDAVLRPAAWPSYYAQSESLLFALSHIPRWQIMFEERCANKGAFHIAQSVTREDRRQSYVATSYPFWLHDLFSEEMYTT
ncbi:uncharacterized protein LOC110230857 [Arabidopsis lyrata subsp. lyrata]|uniref:uncharacterized protein LOC110230857 n=1 Tax=Arabidopsis lyrata subsp. lyrata TaxID=81972 RepID=UPI000A29C23B|nr:uncharacterized protein LOC110230857 [Arabidopsis lyrata subsp. lyrata]|eukprot:XP_020890704.1 uncharacterized protein LOC110230857 [Arabidopsis lyrata subsp. lyrata]